MPANAVVRLKVTLTKWSQQLQPIKVPLAIKLDRLDLVLQAMLGRTNSHLYETRTGDTG